MSVQDVEAYHEYLSMVKRPTFGNPCAVVTHHLCCMQADPAAFDWAPKEFTEDGDDEEQEANKGSSDKPAGAAIEADADAVGAAVQAAQPEGSAPASSSAAQGEGNSDYVYDPTTG
jgi:hypothetical protein